MKIVSKFLLLLSMLLFSTQGWTQQIVKQFLPEAISLEKSNALKTEFGVHKTIPLKYENQILTALSYFPELKDITITFRVTKTTTPLSSRPEYFGLFQAAKNRNYIITISEQSNALLEPILFKNLNFNAQIGVLGHELSHISDYVTKGFSKILYVGWIQMISKKKVDVFERNTDLLCIQHGLGYQLLDWSTSVRQNLKIDCWRGADNIALKSKKERYLNPETIMEKMKTLTLYCKTEP